MCGGSLVDEKTPTVYYCSIAGRRFQVSRAGIRRFCRKKVRILPNRRRGMIGNRYETPPGTGALAVSGSRNFPKFPAGHLQIGEKHLFYCRYPSDLMYGRSGDGRRTRGKDA